MLAYEFKHTLTPSLLDRLLDDRPGEKKESINERLQTLAQVKASVVRDVETLLNTRCVEEVAEGFPEVKTSIAAFGLPDIVQFDPKSRDDQELVRRSVEEAILRFEPRFRRIRVTIEPLSNISQALRFRMDVYLEVTPASEHLRLNASLDLSSRRYTVGEVT